MRDGVTIGAAHQAPNDALFVAHAAGDEDDRRQHHLVHQAQVRADREARRARQQHVEQHEIGRALLHELEEAFTIGQQIDLVALGLEHAREQVATRLVVVDHEHPARTVRRRREAQAGGGDGGHGGSARGCGVRDGRVRRGRGV
jgi:hypothetical protein